MSNPTQGGFEKWLDQHLARNYRIYATIVGLLWIGYGALKGVTTLMQVSANGLGRFATNFGLSHLPGNNSGTSDDVGLFFVVLGGAALLVVGGVLAPFKVRFGVYLGLVGALVLMLLTLLPLLKAHDVGVVVLGMLVPVITIVPGVMLIPALRERKAQSAETKNH